MVSQLRCGTGVKDDMGKKEVSADKTTEREIEDSGDSGAGGNGYVMPNPHTVG